jgi:hypothetical protein
MSKARDLADFVSDGSPLSDGTISVSEVSGAAPTASPSFTGNVGVGTASPDRSLEVYDASKQAVMRVESGQGTAYIDFKTSGTTADFKVGLGAINDDAYFRAGGSERMRIDSNGRVGIGVTSMNDAALEVQPVTDIPQIKLTQNNVADGGDGWKFHASGPTGGNLAIIREASGSDYERMRFHINGGVSFGNTVDYGQTGEVLVSNGQNASPTWQAVSFTTNVITTNTTATANNHYYLNGSAITLTLPASPSVGDEVRISEVAGNTDCIIARNGSNIMSAADDITIDSAYAVIYLRYVDATIGWAFS